ncbi:hypothetical protein ABE65_012195 [Fictibacillus phosphorivorans]|uniref:Uncharacterized protein n=1 Tax=Fictibacillus phosphorivorans TaxID=1221500 RepID=A0A160IND9_9BACL|nr:hypothetical protein [Fictibacillus phosphorivorans]ANC77516.1 hypothetical protein ABE65_012195 [Fictibacillus phosphorivorans]
MGKKRVLPLVLTFLLISGFFTYYIINAKPPVASAKTEANIAIPVKQSSYCWDGFLNGECVDYAEPFMMNEIKAITVSPGENIAISYNRKPIKVLEEVRVWKKGQSDSETAILLKGDIFVAPTESGTYAVSTHGTWKRGSSSQVFFIKVK